MYDHITWEQFEQKFREAFSRKMTPEEHRWFHSIWTVVNAREREKTKGAAAWNGAQNVTKLIFYADCLRHGDPSRPQ